MPETFLTQERSRRGFLDLLLGGALTGWLASMLYPAIRYLKPLPQAGPTGPMRLTRDEVAKLETEAFVIVPVSGKRLMIFADADGTLRALDARCTHEGCTVQYVPGEEVVWCACHNARFGIDGRVLSGPPPRPLPRYRAEYDKDGAVIVTAEVV
jgi:cytochrome b6-f complex iron-sulfur subunit